MRVTASPPPPFGICLALTASILCSLSLPADAGAQTRATAGVPAPVQAELEQARRVLDKYRDPIVAVHDGYFSTVGCIEYPMGASEGGMQYVPGGMGVHFLNLQHIGPSLDPAKPQVLIYQPDGHRLRLVAAEWFVPVQAVGQARPAIFGRELEGPMEGHEPVMPKGLHHYDLHVWLWKENPAGIFSPTNPDVKCPKGGYSFQASSPKLVTHPGH